MMPACEFQWTLNIRAYTPSLPRRRFVFFTALHFIAIENALDLFARIGRPAMRLQLVDEHPEIGYVKGVKKV
jgi:hypothetical protein